MSTIDLTRSQWLRLLTPAARPWRRGVGAMMLSLGDGQTATVRVNAERGHVRIDIDDGTTKAFLVLTPDAAMDLANEIRVAAELFLTRRVEP